MFSLINLAFGDYFLFFLGFWKANPREAYFLSGFSRSYFFLVGFPTKNDDETKKFQLFLLGKLTKKFLEFFQVCFPGDLSISCFFSGLRKRH